MQSVNVNPALFICRTPFQLFNAQEARDRFHAGSDNQLILIYRKKIDLEQMLSVKDEHWPHCTQLHLNFATRVFYPLWLKHAVSGTPSHIYTALTTNIHAHIANTFYDNAKITLLDDGNETLLVEKLIKEGGHRQVKQSLINRLLGRRTKLDYLERASFFTQYKISLNNNEVIENDYRVFRERTKNLPKTQETLFIGSNLVGNYIADTEIFIDLLRQVRDHLPGELSYAFHRYENKKKITPHLLKLGIKPVSFNTIIEQQFLEDGRVPQLIATFRSTAADSLSSLYGTDTVFFEIPERAITDEAKRSECRRLYAYYRESGRQVILLR